MSCSSTLVSSFSMVIKFDAINVTKFLVQTKELVTNFSKKMQKAVGQDVSEVFRGRMELLCQQFGGRGCGDGIDFGD